MVRHLALDVGEVRIGVALSDALGFLATPYTTLYMTHDEEAIWQAVQRLIEETGAEKLVVGLPISLDGQLHMQGQRVKAFGERLREHIPVPLVFWDERLSTVEAERLLAQRDQDDGSGKRQRRGTQGKKRKRKPGQGIDALAATVILQEYLDHLGKVEENKL